MKQNSNGLIVFISTGQRERGELAYVDWVECGSELGLLDDMQRFATEKLWVLATADATKRDVDRFRRAHKSDRQFGNWFKLTPAVMRGLIGEIKRERAELRTTRELRQAA
jgi:hypothetical protein